MKNGKFGSKAALFLAIASMAVSASASVTSDATLQQEVQSKLKSKEFQQVTVKSNNGIVTLGGSVEKYQAKASAEKKAKKIAGVKEVDDQIEVGIEAGGQKMNQKMDVKISGDELTTTDEKSKTTKFKRVK